MGSSPLQVFHQDININRTNDLLARDLQPNYVLQWIYAIVLLRKVVP